MYELDGQEYSLEEIQKAAEESNLTVEEYIQQTGIVKSGGCCGRNSGKRTDSNGSEYGLRIGRYFFGFKQDKQYK